MSPEGLLLVAQVARVDARHHLGEPASWNEHVSPHVMRRIPSEGYRLMALVAKLEREAFVAMDRLSVRPRPRKRA